MKTRLTVLALACFLLIGLSACRVTQTEEGEMPEIDVDVKEGNLPKYDVDGPDVDLEGKETTVTVPDVDIDVEGKEVGVTVPDIDVTLPGEPGYEDDDNMPEDDN